ncbi:Uncharacterised protein [Collinsella intestinalis]|nr:Uncharacterised protein [Collinsella intestinalis]
MMLMSAKAMSTPSRPPSAEYDAPMEKQIGTRVSQMRESPMPASGPMRPTLMPLMARPPALPSFSSIAAATPPMNGAAVWCVLKNSRWRFMASDISGVSFL